MCRQFLLGEFFDTAGERGVGQRADRCRALGVLKRSATASAEFRSSAPQRNFAVTSDPGMPSGILL
jgi:hypothetical protein